jgi:hypothetical protein
MKLSSAHAPGADCEQCCRPFSLGLFELEVNEPLNLTLRELRLPEHYIDTRDLAKRIALISGLIARAKSAIATQPIYEG